MWSSLRRGFALVPGQLSIWRRGRLDGATDTHGLVCAPSLLHELINVSWELEWGSPGPAPVLGGAGPVTEGSLWPEGAAR